jgi:dTDP-4-dehydrorhamnose 3,5-epimerase
MGDTIEFTVKKTEIPGLLEIDLSIIEDSRGWFQEKFQKAKLVAAGFPENFSPVQQSVSYNKQVGVTRGIHAEPWDKYCSVIKGKVYGVYVDLRAGSNFGKKVGITIDPDKAVFVPMGVANSFQTLEEETYYSYLVNAHWSATDTAKYKFVNLADPALAIDWPIPLSQAIISDKDQNHPFLKDVTPFII